MDTARWAELVLPSAARIYRCSHFGGGGGGRRPATLPIAPRGHEAAKNREDRIAGVWWAPLCLWGPGLQKPPLQRTGKVTSSSPGSRARRCAVIGVRRGPQGDPVPLPEPAPLWRAAPGRTRLVRSEVPRSFDPPPLRTQEEAGQTGHEAEGPALPQAQTHRGCGHCSVRPCCHARSVATPADWGAHIVQPHARQGGTWLMAWPCAVGHGKS